MAKRPGNDLDIAEDVEEEAYVEYDIATYPSDYTLDVLQQMKERGDITVPPYQRRYVWTIKQASVLVESFLLGLPVPPLFLYINDQNKSEVIDGQQRLLSMVYYLEGYFGEPDTKGRRQVFKLSGLSEKSPFKNKSFHDLEEKFQRKLRGSVLRAINVRQLNPSIGSTSVFHIFERLNTGGTSLKPQEIRNAVFRGFIVSKLQQMNKNEKWRHILGLSVEDKFQRDVELVLRLFSLYRRVDQYEKPMKEFLNKSMKENREFNSFLSLEFESEFPRAVDVVVEALGSRPFRPKGVINSAILEAVMLVVLENRHLAVGALKEKYDQLLSHEPFLMRIRGGTTDTNMVRERKKVAEEILLG